MKTAITELYKIFPNESRTELDNWCNKWLEEVDKEQLFVKNTKITTEVNDLLCENLAQQCILDLMDSNSLKIEKNRGNYKINMVIIRDYEK